MLPSVVVLLVGFGKVLQGLFSYSSVKCCIVLLFVLQSVPVLLVFFSLWG